MKARPVGELLRGWRERRRLSQLQLSIEAEISARHLSFVETGRSTPSREMILRLAETLDIPLRERNHLLVAGGFAPAYGETTLDSPVMEPVRAAVRQILTAHEPYPAVVVDGHWNMLDANASATLLTEGVSAKLMVAPVNVLRVSLHPQGLAPRIVNLAEWRAHQLGRLHRQVSATGDPYLATLYQELNAYPGGRDDVYEEPTHANEVVMSVRIRHHDRELAFLTTVATFGTPLDITVSELAIESFFPANENTAEYLGTRNAGLSTAESPAGHVDTTAPAV
jgi:transcriptional regulator with XRE-family HTH domain